MIFVYVLMRWVFHHLGKIPRATRSWIISICGVVAIASLLLLWVSMTLGMFKIAIGIWSLAMLIIYIMEWTSPDERI